MLMLQYVESGIVKKADSPWFDPAKREAIKQGIALQRISTLLLTLFFVVCLFCSRQSSPVVPLVFVLSEFFMSSTQVTRVFIALPLLLLVVFGFLLFIASYTATD